MSISAALTPSAAHQLACALQRRARSSQSRASCSRARSCAAGRGGRTARAATISAWVESSPPETPITSFSMPVASQPRLQPGDLDPVDLLAALVASGGSDGTYGKRSIARRSGTRRPGGASSKAIRRMRDRRRRWSWIASPQELVSERSASRRLEVDVGERSARPASGSVATRPGSRRSRRSAPARPRRGRSSTRPARRRCRDRRRSSGRNGRRRACAGSRTCRR